MATAYQPFGGKRTFMNEYEQADIRQREANAQRQQSAALAAMQAQQQANMLEAQMQQQKNERLGRQDFSRDMRDTSIDYQKWNQGGKELYDAQTQFALDDLPAAQRALIDARKQGIDKGIVDLRNAMNRTELGAAEIALKQMDIEGRNREIEKSQGLAASTVNEINANADALMEWAMLNRRYDISQGLFNVRNAGNIKALQKYIEDIGPLMVGKPGASPAGDALQDRVSSMSALDAIGNVDQGLLNEFILDRFVPGSMKSVVEGTDDYKMLTAILSEDAKTSGATPTRKALVELARERGSQAARQNPRAFMELIKQRIINSGQAEEAAEGVQNKKRSDAKRKYGKSFKLPEDPDIFGERQDSLLPFNKLSTETKASMAEAYAEDMARQYMKDYFDIDVRE